ncbi:unnamed protein product [Hymenolepis diminuta]|uniref:FAD synthase n=2 Tax=Hymenolepis diminuta TaxID=6216 RepID=A0A564YZA7_HYMDI|nr:unnamed protein product [Hymenolepis diminuta]
MYFQRLSASAGPKKDSMFQLSPKPYIRDLDTQYFSRNLYSTSEEIHLAKRLSDFAAEFKHFIIVGSYPVQNNRYYKVRISLECQDPKTLEIAHSSLEKLLGDELVKYDSDPVSNAASRVYKMAEEDTPSGQKLKHSIEVIEKIIDKYGIEDIILSFNGGKDCTVLLHLLFAVLNKKSGPQGPFNRPQLFYVREQTPFAEVETFVESTLDFYQYESTKISRLDGISAESGDQKSSAEHPSLIVYSGHIKQGLFRLKHDFPNLRVVFIGTRCDDPWTENIVEVVPTDPGWPEFLRVHPILNWDYTDVWNFIRGLSLPYCCLYDVGYTSLGSMENTHPNPELRYIDSAGRVAYHPAYMLQNPRSERSGRTKNTNNSHPR